MNIFDTILGPSISFGKVILLLCVSLILGFLFSLVYLFIKRKGNITRDFPIALSTFPFVATSLVLLTLYLNVWEQAQRVGVVLAGVFCISRFRSKNRPTDELSYIFFSSATGLALGLGFIGYAILIEVLLSIVLIVFSLVNYPFLSQKYVVLKITIPEDLNYIDAFKDVFDKYTKSASLYNVKTTDMGSLFIVKYDCVLKNNVNQKDFIDELRERNGNLDVQITLKQYVEKY